MRSVGEFSLLLFVFFSVIFLSPGRADGFCVNGLSFAAASDRVVRYGMAELPPFFFKSDDGLYQGYVKDLLELLAEGEGWSLSFSEAPGDVLSDMLGKGQLDILSMAPTPRLEELFDFGKVHHYSTWYTFFTRTDSEILSFQDLHEKRISMQSGFYGLSELRRILDRLLIQYEIVETRTVLEAMELLRSGDVDVCAAEQLTTINLVRSFGFRRSPVIFAPSRIFFAAKKGENSELLAKLDEKLALLHANPLSPLHLIHRRWFYDEEWTFFPRWALLALLSGAVVLIVVAAGLVILYRKERLIRLRSVQLKEHLASERFLAEAARMLLAGTEDDDVLRSACRKLSEISGSHRLLLLRSGYSSDRRRCVQIFFEYALPGLPLFSERLKERVLLACDLPRSWLVELSRKRNGSGEGKMTLLKEILPPQIAGEESFSFYPLFEGARFWGTLALNERGRYVTSESTHILLSTFSEMLSAHLLRKREGKRLLRLATTDPLTGLANRRHFFETIEREMARSLRHERALSLLLCDIDFFKAVNDVHGHDAGDEVLRQFARNLRRSLRSEDIPTRYGGEEFGVLLPEMNILDAIQAAERLRHLIEKTHFTISRGRSIPQQIHLTASFGVGEFRGEGDTPSALFSRADSALYAAKNRGRNSVIAAPSELSLNGG